MTLGILFVVVLASSQSKATKVWHLWHDARKDIENTVIVHMYVMQRDTICDYITSCGNKENRTWCLTACTVSVVNLLLQVRIVCHKVNTYNVYHISLPLCNAGKIKYIIDLSTFRQYLVWGNVLANPKITLKQVALPSEFCLLFIIGKLNFSAIPISILTLRFLVTNLGKSKSYDIWYKYTIEVSRDMMLINISVWSLSPSFVKIWLVVSEKKCSESSRRSRPINRDGSELDSRHITTEIESLVIVVHGHSRRTYSPTYRYLYSREIRVSEFSFSGP